MSICCARSVAADVRFLVVGAYPLALHGRPRATGDLDIWVEAKTGRPKDLGDIEGME